METRKLASIQIVLDVSPIDGADRIECIHVLGWQCVGNRGQFHKGDKCVYIEVDSFLPVEERFEFLRASSFRHSDILGDGFRLKTMKFRGQISQGLVQPLSILPAGEWEPGQDVTDLLGIRKWEEEERVTGNGTVIGGFPDGIPKTDELRVQSYPMLIDELKNAGPYYITTKMDGTSVTMYWKNRCFGLCGRNYEYADDDKCCVWTYAHERNIPEKMAESGLEDIAIQGEYCGAGIQKNRLKLLKPAWYVFTILDLKTGHRLSLKDMQAICALLDLDMVPVEEEGDVFPYDSVDVLLERAKGKYASGMNKEGIVIRPVTPVYSHVIRGPLSMKVLNNDYLLKD